MYRNKVLWMVFLVFCINSFGNGWVTLALLAFLQLDVSLGGLGFSPMLSGIYFGVFGALCFIFQIFFFKRMYERFNLIKTYKIGILCLAFGLLTFPGTLANRVRVLIMLTMLQLRIGYFSSVRTKSS